jgi:uncharacterized membrane protein (UPF0127 family)
VIALLLVAALALPVVIGTAVVIKRVLTDDPAPPVERTDLKVLPPFGRVGFQVADDPTVRCALLAATESSQVQGMQQRRDLAGYDAMVFAFAQPSTASFINHFVPIDLSIAWFDAHGVLVDHTTMAACPSGQGCPTYASRDPYRYAIETPIGGLEAMGLAHAGAVVHIGGICS